jgi:hypothetical protein
MTSNVTSLSVASVEVDESGTPVQSGLVALSDGSSFVNPPRMAIVDDSVQSVSVKILGFSAVADSLVQTKVTFYRGNAGRLTMFVSTRHLPMSSPFVVRDLRTFSFALLSF